MAFHLDPDFFMVAIPSIVITWVIPIQVFPEVIMLNQDQIHQGVEDHLKRYQIIIILIRIELIQITIFKLVTQKIDVIM